MGAYPRQELEEMVERWLATNRRCEAEQDWRPMAEMYTEDATYGWNVGPNDEFMAVGRDEIRELALGLEMTGLEGWTYPYQRVLIDDQHGEVLGLWKQVADATREDGSHYEIAGLGGAGSATPATGCGAGSGTSSTWGMRRPPSWRWSPRASSPRACSSGWSGRCPASASPATTRSAGLPSASGTERDERIGLRSQSWTDLAAQTRHRVAPGSALCARRDRPDGRHDPWFAHGVAAFPAALTAALPIALADTPTRPCAPHHRVRKCRTTCQKSLALSLAPLVP